MKNNNGFHGASIDGVIILGSIEDRNEIGLGEQAVSRKTRLVGMELRDYIFTIRPPKFHNSVEEI